MYLLLAGATVIMACRSEERANAAKEDILKTLPKDQTFNVSIMLLDLSDFQSIYGFAK